MRKKTAGDEPIAGTAVTAASPPMLHAASNPNRRGSTTGGLLAALGILGAFAVVVYIVSPMQLHGGAAKPIAEPIPAKHEANQLLIESLAALIGRSSEVLAIHPRTGSPYLEVVLRLHGSIDDAHIGADEIVVMTHSDVLHTIVLYGLEQDEAHTPPSSESEQPNRAYPRDVIQQPQFPNAWRANTLVQPRLLARGISDMHLQRLMLAAENPAMLRLSLRWSPDSADGEDEAAVLVNAVGEWTEPVGGWNQIMGSKQ